ncbi:ABC transporter permease [Nodularia chucula]|uniref:ABC transporter permease n=1 Tax=Nodularia chucula TaxID=3093667 RepID=UPI0039C6C515
MNVGRVFFIAKNVFQQMVRDRILYIIGFYAILLAIGLRVLPEFAAATEDKMFLDFGIAAMSVVTLIVAIFVGTGLVNQEIDKRTILLLIAKPVSRIEIICGKFLGLASVLAVLVAVMTVIYLGFLQLGNIPHSALSILIGSGFLIVQSSLITAVAITFGVFTSSLLAVTLTFAVYLMGNITPDLVNLGRLSDNLMLQRVTQALYLILPDLSRLDLKNDVVYGLPALPDPSVLISSVVYGLVYMILLLAIANLLFLRREF